MLTKGDSAPYLSLIVANVLEGPRLVKNNEAEISVTSTPLLEKKKKHSWTHNTDGGQSVNSTAALPNTQ